MRARKRIQVKGRVQGVGFRPTAFRYAREQGLAGWISNTSEGVVMEVEGEESRIEAFLMKLQSSPPPLANIISVQSQRIPIKKEKTFEILPSLEKADIKTQISPDISICPDCLLELNDPKDRRYLYPFINCTNCGPRFSIIREIPYDRKTTTMEKFRMCPECRTEYENPLDRRFHAQPDACGTCGPKIRLVSAGKSYSRFPATGGQVIAKAIELLEGGKILAIKGLGGFHLACNPFSDKAVETLRTRKFREDKPFALMGRDIGFIKEVCEVGEAEEELLQSWKRPVVILKKRKNTKIKLAPQIAPGNGYLGFMLPYTPLHYLLFSCFEPQKGTKSAKNLDNDLSMPQRGTKKAKIGANNRHIRALVMTSGNISDEPIVFADKVAKKQLKDIADYFLLHDRDIFMRCDDSVTRVFNGKEYPIRRSRGYAPEPIQSGYRFPREILACGAHQKNTFCLAKDREVVVSHHIGDLENWETNESFSSGVAHLIKLFGAKPEIIACDMHPDYFSTRFATEYSRQNNKKLIAVQHHHAHIVSCMADNDLISSGVPRKVIGVAFDGTGYGEDGFPKHSPRAPAGEGAIWGGEFLIADSMGFERKAHLEYFRLPGGEAAIREPWRVAASLLKQTFGNEFKTLPIDFVRNLKLRDWDILEKMMKTGVNSPLTSSMGRLFDAVSSLVCLRETVNYEGQAAIEFEQLADRCRYGFYHFNIDCTKKCFSIGCTDLFRAIVDDLLKKTPLPLISARFHDAVAGMVLSVCMKIREETGINEIAFSGGVFQNMLLLKLLDSQFNGKNFRLFFHNRVPTNDGGICLGQAIVASEVALKTNTF